MDRATVIVAIPPVDERVHKISSEAIPHLTLLYLGDVDLSEGAMLYVQHACEELSPFGLSVDYRGELGEDSADVLFFEDNAWDLKRVKEFRHWLLLNDEIKRAYDSTEQHPEWTPHLTLGYPDAPARELDDEDRRIGYVSFDRIGVWVDDFEGPTFRLKYDDYYPMEVAMSDMTTAERGAAALADLFHSGVKGMKWGVRKDKGHEGERVKTKKLDKLDKKWEKDNTGGSAWMKHYNAAAGKMNDGGIDAINNKPEYKKAADDGILNDMDHPTTKAYFKEHEDAFHNAMVESWAASGANPSGTKRFEIREVENPETGEKYNDVMLVPVKDDVKHAEGDTEQVFRLTRDTKGLITKYVADEVELKHYGVKGMRWGYTTVNGVTTPTESSRKTSALARSAKDVTVSQRKAGTFVKAKGGARQEAASDAIKAQAARQVAKKSTTDALSTKELKDTIERMRLEQEFAKLDKKVSRRGKSLVQFLFTPQQPINVNQGKKGI